MLGLCYRNELPQYYSEELEKGIKNIDLKEDMYRIPMDSWEMTVAATNVNCINNIFQSKNFYSRLLNVLFGCVGKMITTDSSTIFGRNKN